MDVLQQLLETVPLDLKAFLKAVDEVEDKRQAIVHFKPLLQQKWFSLHEEPAGLSAREMRMWKQNRGYELERILFALFALESLSPSPPFRPSGEQVDGLFELYGRYFLVEAKWENSKLPASAIYSFRGKLEGRLVGTIGLFIAVNGFSSGAADTLLYGGIVNVILFTGEDIDYALQAEYSFQQVLEVKMRRAVRDRSAFYPFRRYLDEENAQRLKRIR